MHTEDRISPNWLRFERILEAPVEKAWQYLTDSELRSSWFMGGATDLKVGGAITMIMGHDQLSDEPVPVPERIAQYRGHSWEERITQFAAPHLLAFSWNGGNSGEVSFAFTPDGEHTRLVLTHTGLNGKEEAASFGTGWHSHLAALQYRIRGEGVADFWRLHSIAEDALDSALADYSQ